MAIARMLIRGAWIVVAAAAVACGSSNPRPLTVPPGSMPDGAPTVTEPGEDALLPAPEPGKDAARAADLDVANPPADLGSDGKPAAGPDAVDAAGTSSPDVGVDMPVAVGCQSGLLGTAPFGAYLSGTASFVSEFPPATSVPITSTVNVQVYFPAGRVAGAPVQLAMQSRVVSSQYFFGPQVTIASDLSASGLAVGGHDMQITGALLPGTGGLQATIAANFSNPGGDVADDRTASMLMCPSGDVPAPSLQIPLGLLSPLSTLGLNATTPIATDAIKALRIASPLGAVQFTVSPNAASRFAGGPNFTVAATSALPPGQPLSFDASGVRDVLGRAVPLTLGDARVLTTTAVLGDLTFAATPPAGSIASSGCTSSVFGSLDAGAPTGMFECTGGSTTANGVLTIKAGYNSWTNVDALLALPSAAATKLRVRMAIGDIVDSGAGCSSGDSYASIQSATMAVVGPKGETSPRLALTCDGGLADHVLDLPSASPLWLAIHVEGQTSLPYFSPAAGPPSVNIDELELM